MRYCIFIANFLPNLGGVERYTYKLSQKLIDKGHQVTVVTSNVFDLAEHEIIDGIEIFRIPCFNLLKGRFPVLKISADFFRIHKKILNTHFDYVIVQSRFYVHCAYGIYCAKKWRLPHFVLEHGTNHFTVNNPVLDWAGALYEHIISAYIRSGCQNFYGVSEACCQWLSHFHISASGKLYNAVDIDEIQNKINSPVISYRDSLSLKDYLVITYAGRLVPDKGILKLVEAMKILERNHIPVKLLIAGNGELYDSLNNMQRENIHMLGLLDFDHIVALLKESDIFCLPTDYPEGFPTSVLEAAACGCYIVTTTKGGSTELILDDSYGTILQENTPETIADAITRAALDPHYRTQAAQKAHQRLCNTFTWEQTSEEVIRVTHASI